MRRFLRRARVRAWVRDQGALYRAVHSAWLTRAVKNPGRHPRILARRVSDGGFNYLSAQADGRVLADWYYRSLLDAPETTRRARRRNDSVASDETTPGGVTPLDLGPRDVDPLS